MRDKTNITIAIKYEQLYAFWTGIFIRDYKPFELLLLLLLLFIYFITMYLFRDTIPHLGIIRQTTVLNSLNPGHSLFTSMV